jgi:hypothetical protein
MLKGLEEILKKTEETAQMMDSGDRIRKLYIQDKEVALLRFISDADEVFRAPMHRVKMVAPSGKEYNKWVYCTQATTGACPHCSGGDKPKNMLYLWSWVYAIMHIGQNPRLEESSDAPRWQPVKQGTQTFYKEEVNGPMVFSISVGRGGSYVNKLVNFSKEYGSLCDRDYKLSRTGKSLDTIYELLPKDPSKKSKEVAAVTLETLPSLQDYIMGKNISMHPEDGIDEEVVKDDDGVF